MTVGTAVVTVLVRVVVTVDTVLVTGVATVPTTVVVVLVPPLVVLVVVVLLVELLVLPDVAPEALTLARGSGTTPPTAWIASLIAAAFTCAVSASVLAVGPVCGTKLNCAARLSASRRVIFSAAARGLAFVTITRSSIRTSTAAPVSRPAPSSLVTST